MKEVHFKKKREISPITAQALEEMIMAADRSIAVLEEDAGNNHERPERRETIQNLDRTAPVVSPVDDLIRLRAGGVRKWSERWGRAIYLHEQAIREHLDACIRRRASWPDVDSGVARILSRRSPDAQDVPSRFLAEPEAEPVSSPQQQDVGGVGCPTLPAPSAGDPGIYQPALKADSIHVRRLPGSKDLFELLLGVRGVVVTREGLRALYQGSLAALLIPIQLENK